MLQDRLLGMAVVLCTTSSLFVAGLVARRELFSPAAAKAADETIAPADWNTLLTTGHRIGPEKAALTVVEFGDFECPACAAFARLAGRFRQAYPDDFAVVFHHYPISYHEFALQFAQASECVARQGRFEAFHDSVFAGQRAIQKRPVLEFALASGIRDSAAFTVCLADSLQTTSVARDVMIANRIHVTGTPTVAVNGKRLGTGIDSTRLADLLRRALKR
jgi:protein-disulfide isomerase